MKILIFSPAFYPNVGGLESIALGLCKYFVSQGHEVKVVTLTASTENDELLPFEVHRAPSFFKLLKLTRWCDLYLQFNVSLKGIFNLILSPKPYFVSHQGVLYADNMTAKAKMKYYISKYANNISCSEYVSSLLPAKGIVIPNAYDNKTFINYKDVKRDKDVIFSGRLVSDKGCDVLLKAFALLKEENITPGLTIVGGGPEEDNLRELVKTYGLEDQVVFTGVKRGTELARTYCEHRIMVVPSTWEEPFGIVALEGIACGCLVIGSSGGGLKDAIGICGYTFRNGDEVELANVLKANIGKETFEINCEPHLQAHTIEAVGAKYLAYFKERLKKANTK